MDIHYYTLRDNFGDHLNAWIWDALVPDLSSMRSEHTLCGIGTLLSDLMPKNRRWVVIGSGTGYSPPPDLRQGEWSFASVRGPLTARVLGLPDRAAVTDSAILLAALPDGRGSALPNGERHGVVFMPHWKQLRFGHWREVCEAAGVEFIDPLQNSQHTVARLRAAQLVLADAMHAAICADTVRVPWVALSISSENHSFKWVDWTSSMEMPYQPREMPPSSFLEKLQSDLSVLLRTDFRLRDTSMESAMAFHANTLINRNSISMAVRRRVVTSVLVMLATVLSLPGLAALRRRLDRRQSELAVEALKAAAASTPCLSRQEVFEARLAESRRRLDEAIKTVRA